MTSFNLDAHIRAIVDERLAALSASAPVQVLHIRDACARMAWSYSWAVRHWDELGGYKDVDTKLKIRADVLSQHPKIPSKSKR